MKRMNQEGSSDFLYLGTITEFEGALKNCETIGYPIFETRIEAKVPGTTLGRHLCFIAVRHLTQQTTCVLATS
jgi:hypothetical protein